MNEMYPAMREEVTLRTEYNPSGAAITIETKTHVTGLRSYCSGSPETNPPWNPYWATLFDTTVNITTQTGGTVSATSVKRWKLKWWNTGGEELLTHVDPYEGPYIRVRVDRGNHELVVSEESLIGGGGDPGGRIERCSQLLVLFLQRKTVNNWSY
jgi:hypothetical protein